MQTMIRNLITLVHSLCTCKHISLYQLLNSLLNYYGPRNKAKQKFLKRQGQRIQATSPLTLESRKSGTIRGITLVGNYLEKGEH